MKITTQVKGGNNFSAKIRELQQKFSTKNVFVGLPKGSGNYEDGVSIAVIGAVQEYGSEDGDIPERSFLRVPLRSSQKVFAKIFRKQLPKVVEGELTMFQLLSQVGAKAVSVSQEAIVAGIDPPNAPSTVKRKGSSTPLIDEGILKSKITYVVDEGDEDVT